MKSKNSQSKAKIVYVMLNRYETYKKIITSKGMKIEIIILTKFSVHQFQFSKP